MKDGTIVKTGMLEILQKLVGTEHVWAGELMKNHTTFRVGGPARYLVQPESAKALVKVIETCLEAGVPYTIVGNGSNLLVSDRGYDGVVIHLFKNMSRMWIQGNFLTFLYLVEQRRPVWPAGKVFRGWSSHRAFPGPLAGRL